MVCLKRILTVFFFVFFAASLNAAGGSPSSARIAAQLKKATSDLKKNNSRLPTSAQGQKLQPLSVAKRKLKLLYNEDVANMEKFLQNPGLVYPSEEIKKQMQAKGMGIQDAEKSFRQNFMSWCNNNVSCKDLDPEIKIKLQDFTLQGDYFQKNLC